MEQAAKKTKLTADESKKLAIQLDKQRKALGDIGVGALAVGGVVAAGVGIAIAKFAEFDEAMSSVGAATNETTANMALLRDAAVEAGGSTVYSATEAAKAIEELAKAGLSTADILNGGLDGALALAAAGGLEVADAAAQTAIALKQFGLEGGDASHVAELLAAGAGKAVGDVSDLSQALGQAGLVANGAGQSIEDTTGVLAAFADQGLLGPDAGTSLKSALIALQAPTDKARKLMDQYNLSFYDGNGQMLSYTEIAGQLESRLGGLDDETRNAALAQIFGNDALRSANVLYSQGATGIQKYIDQTNDSGYAAETARKKLDNLMGDIERLGGSIDTALIQSGSGGNAVLRDMAQAATFLVDGIGSAPQPVLQAGLAIAAMGAATAITGGAALVAVPKIAALKNTLSDAGVSGKTAAKSIGGIGSAVGLATVGVSLLIARQSDIAATTAELVGTLDKATGATTQYTGAAIARKLSEGGVFEVAQKAGISQRELTDAVIENGEELDKIQKKITAQNTLPSFFTGAGIAAGNASSNINKVVESVVDSEQAFKDQRAAGAEAVDSTDAVAKKMTELAGAAENSTVDVDKLKEAIVGFGSVQLDVNSSTRAFEAAIDDLSKSVEDNGATLDVGTEKGRANQAALDEIASSTLNLAAATYEQTGTQESATAAIEAGRAKLIESLGQFGITGQAAQDYADRLGLIPGNIDTVLQVTGASQAEATLAALTRTRQVHIQAIVDRGADVTPQSGGTTRPGFAEGGPITGAGGPTQDNIPIWASVGEHMLDADDVTKLGGHGAVYALRAALDKGIRPVLPIGTYAQGGRIDWAGAERQQAAMPQVQWMMSQPPTRRDSGDGGSGAPARPPINIDMHPSQGLSESDIAKNVAAEINWAMKGDA